MCYKLFSLPNEIWNLEANHTITSTTTTDLVIDEPAPPSITDIQMERQMVTDIEESLPDGHYRYGIGLYAVDFDYCQK